MKTITKRDLNDLILLEYLARNKTVEKKEIWKRTNKFLHITRGLITTGHQIRLKRLGWIGGIFKKGGRPVRNIKTGVAKAMPDTYCIKFRAHLRNPQNKVNAGTLPITYAEFGLDEESAEIIYKVLLALLNVEVMQHGNRIEIRGFGVFSRRVRGRRIGRNPKTGETVEVEAAHILAFKSAGSMVAEMEDYFGMQR